MAPKRKRAHNVFDVKELQSLPRRDLFGLLRALRDPSLVNALTQPETSSWHSLDDSFHERFDSIKITESFPFERRRGAFLLECAEPSLLVQHVVNACPKVELLWADSLRKYPSSLSQQWRCVVGFDEFMPGDKFNCDHNKKTMCLYFSFVEIDSMSQWFCPLVVRANQADAVVGGWSRILAWFMHRMFLGPLGLSTAGLAISLRRSTYVVYARLANLLTDGDGFRKAFAWKGAASLKPSLLHYNVVKKNTDLTSRCSGFVETSCANYAEFKKTTRSHFEASCDLVAEAHRRYQARSITKVMFDNIQKVEGFNYCPGGIAYDMSLRGQIDFFSAITMDWVHILLQDGVLTDEVWLILEACKDTVSRDNLEEFFKQGWSFPQTMQTKGKLLFRVFSSHRLNESDEFDKVRASCAELLGIYSLLRYFLSKRVPRTDRMENNWQSFDHCCRIIDLILAIKKKTVPVQEAATMLRNRIAAFMRAHTRVYGSRYVRPKHAWLWDIPNRIERDEYIVDCFVVERLHLWVKAHAAHLRSLQCFERSVLSGVINAQVSNLQSLNGRWCLHANTTCVDAFPGVQFANSLEISGVKLSIDDIIFHHDTPGKLVACALQDGILLVIAEMWSPVEIETPHARRWRCGKQDVRLIPAAEVDLAVAWMYIDAVAPATVLEAVVLRE